MSFWARLLDGAAGIGGPLGALLSGAVGRLTADRAAGIDNTRRVAFTIGVVALGAKMAKADGAVNRSEIAAFRAFFRVDDEDAADVARVFDLAKQDVAGFESYARQLAELFPGQPDTLEKVLTGLFQIAAADGVVGETEVRYLRAVGDIFGLDECGFHRAAATVTSEIADPWVTLGVPRDADAAAARRAWRSLAQRHHPDRLAAQGLPPEARSLAERKMAAINAAYDRVRRAQGAPVSANDASATTAA